jgi:hypothetical protein
MVVMMYVGKQVGQQTINTPLGPQIVARYSHDKIGPGIVEGLDANDPQMDYKAYQGVYQVIEGGEKGFRLKWVGMYPTK